MFVHASSFCHALALSHSLSFRASHLTFCCSLPGAKPCRCKPQPHYGGNVRRVQLTHYRSTSLYFVAGLPAASYCAPVMRQWSLGGITPRSTAVVRALPHSILSIEVSRCCVNVVWLDADGQFLLHLEPCAKFAGGAFHEYRRTRVTYNTISARRTQHQAIRSPFETAPDLLWRVYAIVPTASALP